MVHTDNRHGKLYIPKSGDNNIPSGSLHPHNGVDNEFMDVEDTKHKVYIYNLDKELEDSQSDEDTPIFLPDIEKHLSKLPKVVLISEDEKEHAKNMQMVLYNVPTSLTVSEDKDSVRKAIIE